MRRALTLAGVATALAFQAQTCFQVVHAQVPYIPAVVARPPPATFGSQPLTPLASYPAIFAEAEACLGLKGDYSKIVWRVRPGNYFTTTWGTDIGYWSEPDTITLARDWVTTRWVVKHEMIHFLLQQGHSEWERLFIWGFMCQATWEFLPKDPHYKP